MKAVGSGDVRCGTNFKRLHLKLALSEKGERKGFFSEWFLVKKGHAKFQLQVVCKEFYVRRTTLLISPSSLIEFAVETLEG